MPIVQCSQLLWLPSVRAGFTLKTIGYSSQSCFLSATITRSESLRVLVWRSFELWTYLNSFNFVFIYCLWLKCSLKEKGQRSKSRNTDNGTLRYVLLDFYTTHFRAFSFKNITTRRIMVTSSAPLISAPSDLYGNDSRLQGTLGRRDVCDQTRNKQGDIQLPSWNFDKNKAISGYLRQGLWEWIYKERPTSTLGDFFQSFVQSFPLTGICIEWD